MTLLETSYIPEVAFRDVDGDGLEQLQAYASGALEALGKGTLDAYRDDDSLQRLLDCVCTGNLSPEQFHLITGMVA